MAEIKFDKGALDKLAKKVVDQQRPIIQQEFDKLARTHKGKPVAEIKRVLKSRVGGMDDRSLTNVATAISEGTPVKAT